MKLISTAVVVGFVAVTLASCAGTPVRTASIDPNAPQSCREVLLVGSNQLKVLCGTDAQWERYDRYQAWSAQAVTQKMQGSSFSGGY